MRMRCLCVYEVSVCGPVDVFILLTNIVIIRI